MGKDEILFGAEEYFPYHGGKYYLDTLFLRGNKPFCPFLRMGSP